jgi:sialate O-acetylesterase
MIAPLVDYAIKGVIWYQGESNVGRAEQYKKLFPQMIQSWRHAWGRTFPFYFVQIAPYRYSGIDNIESAELRFAQNQTLKLRKTWQAVTLDIGDVDNIHPANKKDVGERLARWALAKDYKQKAVRYSGPVCKSASHKRDRVVLKFDIGAEAFSAGADGLKEFELVLSDGSAMETKAVLRGKKIELAVKPGQKPKAVRYAWKNGSTASLFNSAGLPASTFNISIK